MTATLLSADAVLPLDDEAQVYRPGYVVVEDDRLAEVGPQSALGTRRFDREIPLPGRLLMPGLVNAHTHSPMVLFRGLAEGHSLLTLEGWFNAIRVWEAVLDPDFVPPAVEVSCAEMIRTGTTCFADHYFHLDRITPVVRQSGLRAALAYGVVELGDEAAGRRELAAADAALAGLAGEPRLRGWVGPHALFVDNGPEAMAQELALADRYATGLHIHLATSGEEDRFCQEHYGRSAVAQMQALGVLERPLLAAHCLTIPPEDFPTLAASAGFSAVICASAGMRSGVPPAPLQAMLAAGINCALGTDNVANNNTYDLFNEMQTTAKLMSLRERQPGAIPARDILCMATRNGARALGLGDEIGSLEAGKQADLIALDLNGIGWAPTGGQDIYTALVYSVSGLHVRDVLVAGAWLLREGAWTTLDYAAACARLEAAQTALQAARRSLMADGG
jgi:5-methylthioadenosine/S-adenosylhomocysteine deaminase